MNGQDFLLTAQALAESDRPCDLRSAVSRAYYGAYHAALGLVHDCGIRFSKHAGDVHTKMPQCLANTKIPDAELIARWLNSLRSDRNDADYEMESVRMEERPSVAIRVERAAQIVQFVDSLRSSPEFTNLRTLLVRAAQNLGLQVVT